MFILNQLCGFGGSAPAGYVKSVQHFEITIGTSATSNTATISSVNTATSVVMFGGFTTTHNSTAMREFMGRAALTNATTVTASRDTSSATHSVTVRGCVVEFSGAAVVSVQQGSVTVGSGNTAGTAAISSVNTANSVLFYLGVTNTTTATNSNFAHCRMVLTDATTVTATRGATSTAVLTAGFAVVEFAAGIIKSIQQRSVTATSSSLSTVDTISGVAMGRAMLVYNGVSSANATLANYMYNLELTAATDVTLTRTGTSTATRTVNYTVVEFMDGVVKGVQRDVTAVSSVSSADATISGVNTAKAALSFLNFSCDGSSTDTRYATSKLFDATTVRSEKNTAGAVTSAAGWEVVEFW